MRRGGLRAPDYGRPPQSPGPGSRLRRPPSSLWRAACATALPVQGEKSPVYAPRPPSPKDGNSTGSFRTPRRSVPCVRGVVVSARQTSLLTNPRPIPGGHNHNPYRTPLRSGHRLRGRSVPFRASVPCVCPAGSSLWRKTRSLWPPDTRTTLPHSTPLRSGQPQARAPPPLPHPAPSLFGTTHPGRRGTRERGGRAPQSLRKPGGGAGARRGFRLCVRPPPPPRSRPAPLILSAYLKVSEESPLHSAPPPRPPPVLAFVVSSFGTT